MPEAFTHRTEGLPPGTYVDTSDPDAAEYPLVQVPETEEPKKVNLEGLAVDHLRSFIERVERLEEEKITIATDIKEVYAEAKSSGFDINTIKKIVIMRKKDQQELAEEEELLELYRHAVGL